MTNEYKQFAEFGMDDKGITFLSEASKKNRTKIDEENVKLHQK